MWNWRSMEDYRKPLTVEFYESICLPQGVFRHTSIGTEILHLDTFYCESHHNSIVVLVNRRLVSSACSSQADVRRGMCGDVEVGSKNVRWKRQREIGVLFGISKLWDSPPCVFGEVEHGYCIIKLKYLRF